MRFEHFVDFVDAEVFIPAEIFYFDVLTEKGVGNAAVPFWIYVGCVRVAITGTLRRGKPILFGVGSRPVRRWGHL